MPEIVQAQPPLPKDEQHARTVHCPVCNAPPNRSCHRITWALSGRATAVPRDFHGRRLKDATRLAAMKEKHGG